VVGSAEVGAAGQEKEKEREREKRLGLGILVRTVSTNECYLTAAWQSAGKSRGT